MIKEKSIISEGSNLIRPFPGNFCTLYWPSIMTVLNRSALFSLQHNPGFYRKLIDPDETLGLTDTAHMAMAIRIDTEQYNYRPVSTDNRRMIRRSGRNCFL